MKEYLDYDQKYPDLIVRLVQFFKNNSKGEKKIWEFCESFKFREFLTRHFTLI